MSEFIVTGGTGFIGRNLIRRLIAEDNRVYALVRAGSKNLHLLPTDKNVIPVTCNLKEIAEVKGQLPADCDCLFHFAWGGVNRDEIDDDIVQQRNVDDSVSLLRFSIENGYKSFVFAGSRSEYGIQKGYYSEGLECHPQVAYGRTKLEFGNIASDLCKNTDTRFLHPRIFSVYGPDDHPWSLIYSSVVKMLKDEDIELSECKHKWNFMEIRDAVDLIYSICKNRNVISEEDNGIFNVATGDIRPLKDYVEEMKSVINSKSNLLFGAFEQSAESAVSLIPDMNKVENILGWKPKVTFADGIRRIIEKLENNNA